MVSSDSCVTPTRKRGTTEGGSDDKAYPWWKWSSQGAQSLCSTAFYLVEIEQMVTVAITLSLPRGPIVLFYEVIFFLRGKQRLPVRSPRSNVGGEWTEV